MRARGLAVLALLALLGACREDFADRRSAAGTACSVGGGDGPHHRHARPLRRLDPAALQDRSRLPHLRPHGGALRRCRGDRDQGSGDRRPRPRGAGAGGAQRRGVARQRRGAVRQRPGRGGAPEGPRAAQHHPAGAVRSHPSQPRDHHGQPDARPRLAAQGQGCAGLYASRCRFRRRHYRALCRAGAGAHCRPEGGDAGAAGGPGGGDRGSRQAGRAVGTYPRLHHHRQSRTRIDEGRRRARDRSHRRSQHAHTQRLPHPERSARGLPPRRHRLGHVQPAGRRRMSTCRRRRCSRRTARPSSGWSIRPRARCRSARSPSAHARATASSSPPASRRASASSLPACTASPPASRSRCRNERLQPLDLGAAAPLLRLVPDAADRGGGRPLLHAARPRGGPRLHHQEHGGLCELARRHGRGDDQPGHRPHRAQAAGARHARLHQELHDLGPDHDLRQSQGRHARAPSARDLGPGAQQGERHPGRPAVERAGRQLQRPVRRRVRQHLRANRRRPLVPPAARLCRAGARRDPENPRRRQGRAFRHAGRGHPSQLLDPARRGTGARPAGGAEQPAAAERGGTRRASSRPGPSR